MRFDTNNRLTGVFQEKNKCFQWRGFCIKRLTLSRVFSMSEGVKFFYANDSLKGNHMADIAGKDIYIPIKEGNDTAIGKIRAVINAFNKAGENIEMVGLRGLSEDNLSFHFRIKDGATVQSHKFSPDQIRIVKFELGVSELDLRGV